MDEYFEDNLFGEDDDGGVDGEYDELHADNFDAADDAYEDGDDAGVDATDADDAGADADDVDFGTGEAQTGDASLRQVVDAGDAGDAHL